ncbi:MAG: choice-of-anchor D domain-containing protein [Terriglobales bacterium]
MQFLPRMAIVLFLSAWPLSYAAAQQLQCKPCSNDYGQVQTGTSKQYVFQLTNTGKRKLHILSKWKNGKSFSFGNFRLPVTLGPGKSTQLPINFTPLVTGKITGTITLISDALNPKLIMGVSGIGVNANAGTLGVAPSSLNFGNVVVGSPASRQLTLSASNGSVTISSAQLTSSEFSVPGLVLPLTLAAGQSLPVTVVFVPNASGTASANLVLKSDAVNSPTTVPLTGVGVAVGAHSTDLSWDPSNDPVIGYNVYRGGKKGGPYAQLNPVLDASTNYTDGTVNAGATYYYVVTAVNADNMESGYSNEVKVVIPNP